MASRTPFFSLGSKQEDENERNVVIKVKHGDTLRRFGAYVNQQQMIIEYDMNKLRAKISNLFKFSDDAVLVFTYTDEDGDAVGLDSDDELRDALLNQRLNPLRIIIHLKPFSNESSYSRPKVVETLVDNSDLRSDTPSSSRKGLPELATELNLAIEKSLRPVPDPIRGVLANLSRDVIRTASTAPVLNEVLSLLSQFRLSNASQSYHHPVGESSGMPRESPMAVNLNTCNEPKTSSNPLNQLPTVIPNNIVDPFPQNVQKMPEASRSSAVDFDQNLNKDPNTSEVRHDVKPPLATELPSMPIDAHSGNTTLESSVNPNPSIAAAFLHGNTSANKRPSDASGPFHFDTTFNSIPHGGFTQSDETLGNWHTVSTAIPFSNSSSSNATSFHPINTTFSFPLNGHSDFSGNRFGTPTSFSGHPLLLHPYRRSSSCHEYNSRTFHKGVICDGCGMHPIMGPRYKSTVKENYDLCSTCFQDMGKATEYTRIDWSSFCSPKTKKGHHHHKHKYRNRFLSTFESFNQAKVPMPRLESCFIRDVTVWDGTVMLPSSRFTKIWRMRNNGKMAWPFGTKLVWVRGDNLGGSNSTELEIPEIGFPVDEELDVAVDFVAPPVVGQYISYWQMESPSGQKFGEEVWAIIEVDDRLSTLASSAYPSFLNLNLPPENSHQREQFVVCVDSEPLDCIPTKPVESGVSDEILKPTDPVMPSFKKQVDASFLQSSSENPTLMHSPVLIEVPVSTSPVSNHSNVFVEESLTPVPNPMESDTLNSIHGDMLPSSFLGSLESVNEFPNPAIDVSDSLPPISYPLIDIHTSSTSPDKNHVPLLAEEDTVEQTLLRELEEMGFMQIDLNKEILRQNQYDLEQAVEDLCGFSEWDPLLKDLQDMGFNDRELNRKLLSKNGGSIKRVVMELITGEKSR